MSTKDINPVPELNHLVLCTTDIAKTAGFYHTLLGIAMSEIEQLKHETPVTQLARYALDSLPQPILGFLKPTITSHLKATSTQICYLRTTGDAPLLVLKEEQDYETKTPIPVAGNTVYKTSWLLSPGVDVETLAWDFSENNIGFDWADVGSDGKIYTSEQTHSLFLRDPDGRLVELIPNMNQTEETSIVSKFTKTVSRLLYPTIYTDKPEAWGSFMNNTFKIKDAHGVFYQHDSGETSEIISWSSNKTQWPLCAVICVTKPDGQKIPYTGYGLEHIGYTAPEEDLGTVCSNTDLSVSHKPLRPDKSYEHRLCHGPDDILIEYMIEAT